MTDKQKTKQELIQELDLLRQRVAVLEQSELARKRAEEALYTEIQRFQTLTEQAPFGMVMINQDGTFKYINPKFRELFGYELTDVPDGKTWFRKAYPDPTYRHHVIGTWIKDLEVFKPGEKRFEVFTVTCKDGTEKIINFIPVQLATGENLMACEDITERKRAEEALRESEEKFRLAFDNANTGMCLVDLNGLLTKVNRKMCDIFGYRKEELEGMSVNTIAYPEDQEVSPEFIKHAIAGKNGSLTFEKRYFHKQGHIVWGQVSSSLVRDAEGIPLYFISQVQDITERKQIEKALRKSEERFRELFDHAPVSYHEFDLEGHLTRVNRTELELLGYTHEEMIGQPIWKFNVEEESARKRILGKLAGDIPPSKGYELTYRRKDGATIWLLAEDRLILGSEGRITGMRGIFQDITERKLAEEALRRSEKEATRLARENAIMAEIGRIINSTLNIEEVYRRFAEKVKELIPFDRIAS